MIAGVYLLHFHLRVNIAMIQKVYIGILHLKKKINFKFQITYYKQCESLLAKTQKSVPITTMGKRYLAEFSKPLDKLSITYWTS